MNYDLYRKDKKVMFLLKNTKTLDTTVLNYSLFGHSVTHRWIEMIQECNNRKMDITCNYKRIVNDPREYFTIFQENIQAINNMYDKKIPVLYSFEHLSDNLNLLNDLHEEYEIYGDRVEYLLGIDFWSMNENDKANHDLYNNTWPGFVFNEELHERFLRLNDQIHQFESFFYDNDNDEELDQCYSIIDFLPAGLHEDLKPEDSFLFTPELKWGYIYLGYNTLGKHWLSSMYDNDVEVVKRKQIRPQQRFAPETFVYFGPDSAYMYPQIMLHKWWQKNNFSVVYQEDMKIKDYNFGFIPLGFLDGIVKDGQIQKIAPNKITHTEKLHFNKYNWSKYDTIENFWVEDINNG